MVIFSQSLLLICYFKLFTVILFSGNKKGNKYVSKVKNKNPEKWQ